MKGFLEKAAYNLSDPITFGLQVCNVNHHNEEPNSTYSTANPYYGNFKISSLARAQIMPEVTAEKGGSCWGGRSS